MRKYPQLWFATWWSCSVLLVHLFDLKDFKLATIVAGVGFIVLHIQASLGHSERLGLGFVVGFDLDPGLVIDLEADLHAIFRDHCPHPSQRVSMTWNRRACGKRRPTSA